jgi:hypothetical protein
MSLQNSGFRAFLVGTTLALPVASNIISAREEEELQLGHFKSIAFLFRSLLFSFHIFVATILILVHA